MSVHCATLYTRQVDGLRPAEAASSGTLSIRLLGGVDAELCGTPLRDFKYNKVKALLAMLGSRPSGSLERRTIAAHLWPNQISHEAARGLRNALAELRRALRHEVTQVLRVSDGQLSLRAGHVATDVEQFQSCTARLQAPGLAVNERIGLLHLLIGLFRGPFAYGLELDGHPQFGAWLHAERQYFHDRAVSAHHDLIDCYLERGEPEEAIRIASRCLTLDGSNEATHRQMMLALAQCGRPHAAVEQYHRCLSMLRQEFDSDPSSQTRATYQRIASGDVAAPAASHSLVAQSVRAPERRQLTILCARLSGGGEPNATQRAFREVVQLGSGHVQTLSHGFALAYFGYPTASEHAVHRAVDAACALVSRRGDFAPLALACSVSTEVVITRFDDAAPDAAGQATARACELAHAASEGECLLNDRALKLLKMASAPIALPFIGRESELSRIAQAWALARRGRPQCLVVEGEAGIGKSRLVDAACARLDVDPRHVLRFSCSAATARAVSQREALVAALRAGSSPTVVIVENLQWADASALEILRATAPAGGPRLVLVTTRPRPVDAVLPMPEAIRIPIGPLSHAQAHALIGRCAPTWSAAEIERAWERCDGNPRFIEALTRGAREGGECIEDGAVPAELVDLLMEQLDLVPQAREVAHVAATIGRKFAASLVAQIASADGSAVADALDQLTAASLIEPSQDRQAFRFRHALLRDVAYASQLDSLRQQRQLALARTREAVDRQAASIGVPRSAEALARRSEERTPPVARELMPDLVAA